MLPYLPLVVPMVTGLTNALLKDSEFFELFKEISKRLVQSRKEYQERVIVEPLSPFEKKRQSILSDLNQLQSQIILSVSDPSFLTRLLPLILDQMLNTYQAEIEQELNLVIVNIGQIKGYVEQYRKMMRQRAIARWAAVVVSVAALIGLGAVVFTGTMPSGPRVDTVLPVLQLPLPVLLWSAIGSFTAMLYRFNSSGDIELQDPLRWLFTRPLTGIVMGAVTYLVFKIGLLAVSTQGVNSLGSTELLSLIAFLSGFSDRFADGLLRSLVGRFGGDAKGELVTVGNTSASLGPSDSTLLMDAMSGFGDTLKERGKIVRDALIKPKDKTDHSTAPVPATVSDKVSGSELPAEPGGGNSDS